MLSLQGARSVLKTLQRSGVPSFPFCRKSLAPTRKYAVLSASNRFKSTVAAYESDEEELEHRTKGLAAAAALGAAPKSHEEAWMVNLGRNHDNELLLGPRDLKWFTGLPPIECPGKCCF